MVEVRNTQRELRRLRVRLVVAMLLVVVCFGLLLARFGWKPCFLHPQTSTAMPSSGPWRG